MRNAVILLFCIFFAASVAGCTQPGVPLPGRRLVAAMEQGLLGETFNTLSLKERRQALLAEYKALEYTRAGATVSWGAAGKGAFGSVVPGQPYQVGSLNCRYYSHNFTVGGVPQTERGSACRNSDGSWTPL